MILEAFILDIVPERVDDFHNDFVKASAVIARSPGYLSHTLQQCVEQPARHLLQIRWQSLEAHMDVFRGSELYAEWSKLVHPYIAAKPEVLHYTQVYPRG